MMATFLRPGKWKELRQKHCTVIDDGETRYLRVAIPNGKNAKREVVSMPEAILIWNLIVDRDGVDPERFLFLNQYPNRETAKARMDDMFEALLVEADLRLDQYGNHRTLYSLRHCSLTLRLINGDGIKLPLLAQNAGTSLQMLDRFYLRKALPAMDVANLQSFKPSRGPAPIELHEEKPRGPIQIAVSLAEPDTGPVGTWA
jgi:hypothetical protein